MDVSFPYLGSGVDMSSDNNIADPVLSDSEFSSLTSSDEEESNDSDENNMECPNVPNGISFEDGLRRWALETNQRHCAINSLLALVYGMPKIPVMMVAIYCGECKPDSVEEYLGEFVTEFNELQIKGLFINGKKIKVLPRAIIADSPARAFLKGVVCFNAAEGCLKCLNIAKKDPDTKRMYFEGIGATKRTYTLFKG
uniref:Uncharacterized protein n=1 Tax=Anopheles arabiensis TaxID=7173 RepID=A0A182IEP9_ANOAR